MLRRTFVHANVVVVWVCLVFASASLGQNAEYGDAPDGINACQIGGSCSAPASQYPTLDPTANATAGRTGPFHVSAAPAGGDYFFGLPPTVEAAPMQPCCDWLTPTPPADPCDTDDMDGALLCLDPSCDSGIITSAPISPATCGSTVVFGPVPCLAPAPGMSSKCSTTGFWIVPVTWGVNETGAAPRFLNVVVDDDWSGKFGDSFLEWVGKDIPIGLNPGGTATFTTDSFPVTVFMETADLGATTWGIVGFWTRFMVGPEALTASFGGVGQPAQWDGSGPIGGYNRGETEDWFAFSASILVPPPNCGNNDFDISTESCDGTDSGTIGCAVFGAVEPNACRTNCTCCGDGTVDVPIEECDDKNNINDDGCSSTCTFESGFTCSTPVPAEPTVCVTEGCGDGIIEVSEECDDGNNNNGDGCSATCTVEPGSKCTGEPSVCITGAPTVSEWGLVVMALLILTAGTLVCARRWAIHA